MGQNANRIGASNNLFPDIENRLPHARSAWEYYEIISHRTINAPRYIMTTPARFRAAFMAALTAALPQMIDAAWANLGEAQAKPPIRKREAQGTRRRLEKNRMRLAVTDLIADNDKQGLTRTQIRGLLPHQPGIDGPVSESTLKRALMDLRARGEIETRNSRWHRAPPAYLKNRS